MEIKNISLNMYSFGYSAGFIRPDNAFEKVITLEELVNESRKLGLAGIEFPFDKYFDKHSYAKGVNFLKKLSQENVKFFLDFENLNVDLLKKVIPELASLGIRVSRIKMDQTRKTIYGGNRHMMVNFEETKKVFISKLKNLASLLKEYDFTLAIENHQDLHSLELMDIIQSIDPNHLGINWDVGNSISCLDTVDSFYQNTKEAIKNVHLKDYKVYSSRNGIRLVRCPIGSGYVDYKKILNDIDENKNIESYSIELGAQITRECHLNDDAYWNAYSSIPISKESFSEYVDSIISEDGEAYSSYELGIKGKQLFQSEFDDVYTSVVNLSSLV